MRFTCTNNDDNINRKHNNLTSSSINRSNRIPSTKSSSIINGISSSSSTIKAPNEQQLNPAPDLSSFYFRTTTETEPKLSTSTSSIVSSDEETSNRKKKDFRRIDDSNGSSSTVGKRKHNGIAIPKGIANQRATKKARTNIGTSSRAALSTTVAVRRVSVKRNRVVVASKRNRGVVASKQRGTSRTPAVNTPSQKRQRRRSTSISISSTGSSFQERLLKNATVVGTPQPRGKVVVLPGRIKQHAKACITDSETPSATTKTVGTTPPGSVIRANDS